MLSKKSIFRKQRTAKKADIFLSYEITYEAIPDPLQQQLPQSVRDELEAIYTQLTSLSFGDERFVARLEELVKEYPDKPKIANFLVVAYQATQHPQLEEEIYQNYLTHPTYLFARLHYAESCLKRMEFAKVREIFKEGFNLKLLYPERDCFHFSEFIGFNSFIFRYFLLTNDHKTAKAILQELERIAPEHPFTLRAKRMLEISRFHFKDIFNNKKVAPKTKTASFEA